MRRRKQKFTKRIYVLGPTQILKLRRPRQCPLELAGSEAGLRTRRCSPEPHRSTYQRVVNTALPPSCGAPGLHLKSGGNVIAGQALGDDNARLT